MASSPRRTHSRKKCQDCREAKQKVLHNSLPGLTTLIWQCLPVERVWPNICERCLARGLPCSEPGGTRNRARLDNPQMIPPALPEQEPPQRAPPVVSSVRQSQSIIDNNSIQSTAIGISDDANLSILSHAAAIRQTDMIPSSILQETSEDSSMRRKSVKKIPKFAPLSVSLNPSSL